jgi:uncharacterized protein Yka (UPF0111/DUF47 family)
MNKTEEIINSLRQYPDDVIKQAADLLESFNNDWHQPELCTEKYNKLILECNKWEELCDDMYDHYDTPPNIEKKYLDLKKHYDK